MSVIDLVQAEIKRQQETISLIASENYPFPGVVTPEVGQLNTKYSEGYPGRRYYQGNAIIDDIERAAIEGATAVFGAQYANVQSYSGSPANSAVYMALVDPGETIMGMELAAGGHLTHGHPKITFSGRYYHSVQYGVRADGWLDYDQIAKDVQRVKPRLLVCGTTAYPRVLDFERFAAMATSVGALLLADISHIAGLVVGGVHPSPVGVADVVMTTTHKSLRGPRGAVLLSNDETIAKKLDSAVFPGLQGGPHNATTAGIAITMERILADKKSFTAYAAQIVTNAQVLAETLLGKGIELVTGGTDTHLLVLDLRTMGKNGKEAAYQLEQVGLIANANSVPFDQAPPSRPSGVRLGTPALTTRGMKETEVQRIGSWIGEVLHGVETERRDAIAREVKALALRFPIPV